MLNSNAASRTEVIFRAIANGDVAVLEDAFVNTPPEDARAVFGELGKALTEFYDYTLLLSRGDLSSAPPKRKIFIDAGIKQLHFRLNHLIWQLTQVAAGDYGQELDYMGDLSESFNQMAGQLQLREAQIAYGLDHDTLTGLLNREAFKKKVYDLIAASPNCSGILLFSGLDDLKHVNDAFGHDVGDRYIAGAAEIFAAFRKIGALAGRISGDEFAVYLHGIASKEEARKTISNMLSQDGKKSIPTSRGRTQKIRFSVGAAWYPDDAGSAPGLIRYADYAMSESRNKGEAPFVEFNRTLHLNKLNLMEKWESINRLIEEHLVRFAFQPILDLRSGDIYGYEALMRSLIEDFSSPVEILAVASAQSKLPQIEKMTIALVLKWLKKNISRLGRGKIFINSIANRVLSEQDRAVMRVDFAELLPHVVFEIMEGAVEDEAALADKTKLLRSEFGSMVALDDYGSGYSSELRLLNLELDIVKIDRQFITGIHLDRNRQILLSNLLSFCRSKNIKTLAEGVETQEELKTVVELDFDLVQGYFFARPDFELKTIEDEKLDLLSRLQKSREVKDKDPLQVP